MMTGKVTALVVLLLIALLLLMMAIGAVNAHSWYEGDCCSVTDCKPVPGGEVTQHGNGDVTVKGWGLIDKADKRLRWSKDHADHVCAVGASLRCVYRRPGTM